MIASIRGKVVLTGPGFVVVETAGVGYRIFVPLSALEYMQEGREVTLFTYLHVREDAMLLYGFLAPEEKDVFQKLLSVNGIGPKIALGILSVLSLEQITEGINTQNSTYFSSVPGIGPKTAQRIVLELAGKLPAQEGVTKNVNTGGRTAISETVEALIALGYSPQVANEVAVKVQRENPEDGTVDLVKKALRKMVKIK